MTTASTNLCETEATLDVATVHDAHANFVWLTLQRHGVRDADLEDMLQEVFVIVHRKLHTFDGSSRVTTWLFGICTRVAAAHRRRAYVRQEQPTERTAETVVDPGVAPDAAAEIREGRARLEAILAEMDVEKRAVFVMFELEELPCEAIATIVGVPVGTVYSRLFAARKVFEKALTRMRVRDAREGK